ncbi:MAG: autotransporter domain-containing protein [Alphaproteobacteria bacterium]|nr:autotransporter domain-containing protein [Alphaproteobacteria bacterium]
MKKITVFFPLTLFYSSALFGQTLTISSGFGAPTIKETNSLQILFPTKVVFSGDGGILELTTTAIPQGTELYTGNMSDAGSLGQLSINGTSSVTVQLTGALSYTGGTIISSGSLTGNTSPNSTLNLANPGVAYNLTPAQGDQTVVSLGGVANTTVNLGANLTINNSSGQPSTTFSGNIAGAGSLTLSNGANLTLTGTNTYTGGTTVNGGCLLQGPLASLPLSGPLTNNGGIVIDPPAAGGSFDITYPFSGSGRLGVNGPGSFAFTVQNTYTGGTTIEGGATLTSGAFSVPEGGILIDGGSNLTFNNPTVATSYASAISGGGSLTVMGNTPLTLTGNNSYTGGTTINNDGSALTGNTNSITGNITNNNVLTFNNQAVGNGTFAGVISGSGGVTIAGGNQVTFTGINTYTGGTTINNDGSNLIISAPTSTQPITPGNITGNVTNNGTLTFNQIGGAGNFSYDFPGNIIGSGGVAIEGNTGPFTISLTGNNTYSGPTTINTNVGALQGSISPNSQLNLNIAGAAYNLSADQTIGSLAGVTGSGVNLGASTLTITGNVPPLLPEFIAIYNGTINDGNSSGGMGAGNLVINGAPNFNQIFTIPPNYTGSTTINGGTLLVSGPLPATPLILNGGFLSLTVSQNFTTLSGTGGGLSLGKYTLNILGDNSTTQYNFGGNITGAGTFILGGASTGILAFTGSNSYTGGTIISQGSTLIATPASLPTNGSVTNSGTLTFNQSGPFGGAIIGAGAVNIQGGAAVTFTGANTYIGGTTIGILNTNDGSSLTGTTSTLPPGGSINLADADTNLTFNQSSPGTFSGNITGSGSVTMTGGGSVDLTGQNTFTGGTNVGNQSTLVVNGKISNSLVRVDHGSTLRGAGTIHFLDLAGTLSPGNPVGAMTIISDHVSQKTATHEIAVSSNGTSDQVDVKGLARLDGVLNVLSFQKDREALKNKKFTFLKAEKGVTGRFSTLTSNNRLIYTVSYEPKDVKIIVGNLQNFTDAFPAGNTSNAEKTAAYFDTFANNKNLSPDLTSVINGLDAMLQAEDSAAVQYAFNQIQPSQYKELGQISSLNNELVNRTVGSQQQNLRESLWIEKELEVYAENEALSPQRVASFHHLAKSAKGLRSSALLSQSRSQPRHRIGMVSLPGSERIGLPANNWIKLGQTSVWIQSYGQIERTKGNHGNAGIRSKTGGISVGGDHEVLKNTYLGFLGGMSTTPFHWQKNRGSGRVKSYYGGVYGTWLSQTGLYADGQIIGGGDNFNSHRNIVYPGVNRKARQRHNGGEFSADLQAGYVWFLKHLTVQPYADATYMFINESGFREKGAQSLNFKIKSRMSQFFRGELGAQVYRTYVLCNALIRPALQLSWVHKRSVGPNSAKVQGALVSQSQSLIVSGDNRTRNQVAPGLALTAQFADGLYIIGNVNSQFGSGQKLGDALIRVGYDF